MNRKNNITKNQIVAGSLLLLCLCIVFLFVYKAQLRDGFDKRNVCTLMWEHKANNVEELSSERESITQVFTCVVPDLKILTIECKGINIEPETNIEIFLLDPGTGEKSYYKSAKLDSVVNNSKKKLVLKLKKNEGDTENKQFILTIRLLHAGDSKVQVTANRKQGIVTSFDGAQDNKTNIIYSMQYSNTASLKNLFVGLCILLALTFLLGYYLIIIRKQSVEQFYIPVAILMGFIFQCVVTIYGVPDEPWHMDTAYKLSNDLLFVEDSQEPGMIKKRHCDIIMSDMLANGVESNSYYQLMMHTFEKTEDVELVQVSYTDSSNIVPDFIFLPTAIGISIGRVLGLSALLTMQLGRICNLLVFILLTWYAIRKTPYGKNVIAALGFVPIALQQAASASYDAVINGIIFLFIATCLRLLEDVKQRKNDIILVLFLTVLIALVKGGVYLPVLLFFVLLIDKRNYIKRIRTVKKGWIIGGFGLICAVIVVMIKKFEPVISSLMIPNVNGSDKDSLYSLSYLLNHPLNGIYLYWNTIMESGAESGSTHLGGMLGGRLGWHDIQISWIFIVVILISILLLVNVEQDQYVGSLKQKITMTVICAASIVLIMLSMLFACTKLSNTHIIGLQGRYYLPLAPMLFMLTSNSMIRVNIKQCSRIWMTLIIVEIMVVLQFVAAVM